MDETEHHQTLIWKCLKRNGINVYEYLRRTRISRATCEQKSEGFCVPVSLRCRYQQESCCTLDCTIVVVSTDLLHRSNKPACLSIFSMINPIARKPADQHHDSHPLVSPNNNSTVVLNLKRDDAAPMIKETISAYDIERIAPLHLQSQVM